MNKSFIVTFCLITFLLPASVFGSNYLTIPLEVFDLTSFFDHDVPDANPAGNKNFIRHDGQQWNDGSARLGICQDGINCYDGHNGIDLSASTGTNVLAAATGTISTYVDDCGGKTARVYHSEVGYSTLYAHLDSFLISNGTVDRFEYIAKSGESGNCTEGAHLHFGVREGQTGGRRADPYGWDPDPGAPVQDDPCEGYSQDLCTNLGYLWTTDPPSLEPPGGETLPVIPVSGNITENTTWEAGYVYLIQGSVTVNQGVTLTLEPGVIVKFQTTSSHLNINGYLDSQGTPQNKIYFTSYKDDDRGGDSNGDGNLTRPAFNDWRQIIVNAGAVADISNSVVRYGGNIICGSYNCTAQGVLFVQGGVLRLSLSTLTDNRHGIYMSSNGYTNISGSTITNSVGDAIGVKGSTINLNISDSTISDNGGSGLNTYYSSDISTTTVAIIDSTFSQNEGLGFSVAGNILDLTVVDTHFADNQSGDGNINVCDYYYQDRILNFTNYGNTTSGPGANGFRICGAKISNDQTWNPGVPFILGYAGFSIPIGKTLTISPGTIVKFDGDSGGYNSAYFSVNGILNAQGTPQNKIYFTSYKDDDIGGDSNGDGKATKGAPEDYAGINVNSNGLNSGSINISNSILRYGGECQGQYTCQTRGVISGLGSGASIYVDSSTINDNDEGIYFADFSGTSTISVSNSLIDNNNNFGIRTSNPFVNLSVNQTIISNHDYDGIYVANNSSGFKSFDISVLNSRFVNNKEDAYFYYYQGGGGEINFINQGNTNSGTSSNGFRISGTLKNNQIWNSGVPFIVSGISVPVGSTLAIKPGTVVKFFNENSYLNIHGSLSARGANPEFFHSVNPYLKEVYFTSYKDDSVGGDSNGDGKATIPAPGDYTGISIFTNASADISRTVLRYGGQYRGVISSLGPNAYINIASSTISYNYYGAYRDNGEVDIISSSIKENTLYGVFHTGTGSSTIATNNWWGDTSGPYHPNQNPNGTGDRVSDGVEFTPWLLEDPL